MILLLALAADLTYFGDVLPLLRENCLGCHAHGVNMGSLDLETWEGVQRGGNQGRIVIPGKPEESRFYLILVGRAEPRMPLDGRDFPKESIERIRQWIEAGARPGSPEKGRAYGRRSLRTNAVCSGVASPACRALFKRFPSRFQSASGSSQSPGNETDWKIPPSGSSAR